MKRRENTMLVAGVVAFATLVFATCHKRRDAPANKIDWIIETYFLPNDEMRTVQYSFMLCETKNERALDNLIDIYKANDVIELQNALDKIAQKYSENTEKPVDALSNDYMQEINILSKQIANNSLTPNQLAYEYAYFQHRIYLEYPDSIPPGAIRNLYKMATSNKIDDCLVKHQNIAQTDHTDNKTQQDKKQKGPSFEESGEEKTKSNWTFSDILVAIAFILFFIWERQQGFKYFRLAGLGVIRFFQRLNAAFEPPEQYEARMKKQESISKNNSQEHIRKSEIVNPQVPEQKKPDQIPALPEIPFETSNENQTRSGSPDQIPSRPEVPFEIVPPAKPIETGPDEPGPAKPKPKENILPKTTPPITPKPPAIPSPKPKPEVSNAGAYTNSLYARMPSGNLFFNLSTEPGYPDTPFVITLTNESEGNFNLVNDKETLERLFSMTDQLKDACELLNINSPTWDNYKIDASGTVVRDGEYWRIKDKIKLNW